MTDLAKRLHRCTAFRRLRRLEKATRSEACGSLFWIAATAGEEALKDGISNRFHRNGERAHLRRHRREPEAALVATVAIPGALSTVAVASWSSATEPSCASLRPRTPRSVSSWLDGCRSAIQP